jgi:hypothetical protein
MQIPVWKIATKMTAETGAPVRVREHHREVLIPIVRVDGSSFPDWHPGETLEAVFEELGEELFHEARGA